MLLVLTGATERVRWRQTALELASMRATDRAGVSWAEPEDDSEAQHDGDSCRAPNLGMRATRRAARSTTG